jgi:hypothetical protein
MATKPQKRTSPLVRKSASFPFQVAVACWIDLLGYGAWKHIEGGPIGILDGLQIAQKLARNPDVLSSLRAVEKP